MPRKVLHKVNESAVIDIARLGVLTMIKVAGPVLLTGLVVGLTVSLFQTLTHLQEMTLTFVPKILAVFVSLLIFLPFMIQTLIDFFEMITDRIIALG
ncbi:flagellar biosynthetic protein FliQ [Roseospirillum parvum]|uniref:Flagellar biosynthetic protein FliQ n=1 Tax=Roseospirillum parvum TaxID=83401 RepID=A0A1G8DHD6_9PROT|nr:flagellar biosynthetic protein FliQ [Roseospirillum parvum]